MPAIAAAIQAHIGRAFATVPGGLDIGGDETAAEGEAAPKAGAAAPAAAGSPA